MLIAIGSNELLIFYCKSYPLEALFLRSPKLIWEFCQPRRAERLPWHQLQHTMPLQVSVESSTSRWIPLNNIYLLASTPTELIQ